MATATPPHSENEVKILARLLVDEDRPLPDDLARYFLGLEIRDRDRARMHDLAVRNQSDDLSPAEREEMFAFAKASTLLSILKSRARRSLGVKATRSPGA
ncbi:MAG: hypothetical protein BGO49_15745 [Planctomycetales bacterium 71-10]|nr:MAG: hypothetical protein BGO49_15745 [Planctomycetales bacterium 71-10]